MTLLTSAGTLRTSTGELVAEVDITSLRERMRGPVLTAQDADYDSARQIWNAYFDRKPGLIARCTGAAEVISAVRFAAEHDLLVAVRNGGHSFPGHSSCDDGLVIDLSLQKGIRVDPATRTALAQPGLLQGELDAETCHFGLAVTGGQISQLGISGLTLGGGVGWLCRYRGLTCDNMLSADVVLADGELRRASPQDDADLYWAIRGGGGNFGVVTSFEYRLYPQNECLAGLIAYPLEDTKKVGRLLAEFDSQAPDELGNSFAFLTTPDGQPAFGIGFSHACPSHEAESIVRPLSQFGRPIMNHVGAMPYLDVQRMLDQGVLRGRRYQIRSHLLPELHEDALAILAAGYANTPSPLTLVGGMLLGGAMARVDPDATAFPHRRHGYLVSLLACWLDERDDEANIEWVRDVHARLGKYAADGVFVNNLADEGHDRVVGAYGADHYARLAKLKRKYDPNNLFRMNQNIKPAG